MISHHTQEETKARKTSNTGKHRWEQQEVCLQSLALCFTVELGVVLHELRTPGFYTTELHHRPRTQLVRGARLLQCCPGAVA